MRRRTLGPAAAGGSAADVRSTVFALRRSLALAPAAAGSGKGAAGSGKGAAGSPSPSPASSSSKLSCLSPPAGYPPCSSPSAAAAAKAWTAACAEVSDAPASFHCRFASTALWLCAEALKCASAAPTWLGLGLG